MFFRQFFPENSLMSPSTVKIFDGAIEIRLHSGHWKRKRASQDCEINCPTNLNICLSFHV